MKLYLSLFILSISTLFSLSSQASIFTQCSTCQSHSDYKIIAENTAHGEGKRIVDVFIQNPSDFELKKFRIINIVLNEPGSPTIKRTIELDLNENELQAKDQINYKLQQLSLESSNYTVPNDLANSVYDLVGSSSTRNSVIDSYVNNQNIRQIAEGYTAAILSIAGKVVNVNFTINMKFSDNSYATFYITGISSDNLITLKLVSATDSNNNDIPITKNDFTSVGELQFSDSKTFDEFVDAASRYGWIYESNSWPSGGHGYMECTVNKSGGLSCIYYTQ